MSSDGAYASGVTMESVCEMVEDMHSCLSGKSRCVKMPVPVSGTGPSMYMNFVDNDHAYVSDLSPRRKQSVGSSAVRTSIVSRARFSSIPCSSKDTTDIPSEYDVTVQDIDDLIRDMSVHDNISEVIHEGSQSSESRAFMSDTSDDDANDMEDVDADGLPVTARKDSVIQRPVLKRVESIIHAGPSKAQEIRIGAPASRFSRRV
jgi:hypothetical protein